MLAFWISIAVSVALVINMLTAAHQMLVTVRLYRSVPLADFFRTLRYTLRTRNAWVILLPILSVFVFCFELPRMGISYPRIILLPVVLLHLDVLALYGMPPSVLLLGSSRWESVRLFNLIERGIYPYRVVILLEPSQTEPTRHSRFHWGQFEVDNLRILGPHSWRDVVRRISRSVPIVVLDTRFASSAVVAETEQMIQEPFRGKTLFVIADDGSAPAITATGRQVFLTDVHTARLQNVVGSLKDMGLRWTTSPDDSLLWAKLSHTRNGWRMARGMTAVARLGGAFATSLDSAERVQGRSSFVMAARKLQERLNGKPGDGALEVFAQLSGDIAETEQFIMGWQHADGPEVQNLIDQAHAVLRELRRLQQAVDQAPPVFLKRNEETLRELRGE